MHYQGIIAKTFELNGCIKWKFWQNMFGCFSLTEKGRGLKNKLKEDLAYLDECLPIVITTDKLKAFEALKHIKGNIFF